MFDTDEKHVAPRHAVRRIKDTGHIYCITETENSNSEVIRVSLCTSDVESAENKPQLVEVFESHSSRVVLVEPDPGNASNLFILDDEQRIFKIQDNGGDGKAVVLQSVDMTLHDLEDELALLD